MLDCLGDIEHEKIDLSIEIDVFSGGSKKARIFVQ